MPKLYKVILSLVILIVVVGSLLFAKTIKRNSTTHAVSNSKVITTQSDWASGTLSNIDIATVPGDIQIDTAAVSKMDISGATATADAGGSPGCILDSSATECWVIESYRTPSATIKVDLGEVKTGVNFVKPVLIQVSNHYDLTISSSVDDSSYTAFYSAANGGDTLESTGTNTSARYYKLQIVFHPDGEAPLGGTCSTVPDPLQDSDYGCGFQLAEFELYSGGGATHISAASQIDGSEGGSKQFIQWETFTPTQTVPANTAVKYRFRTSSDSVNWTSWSASQTPSSGSTLDISSIASSGDGANKYLQVETTLTNTDGSATPSIESYSVAYHTDVKPAQPTAQTAVVQ